MIIYLLFIGLTLSRTLSDIMRKKNSSAFSLNGLTGSLFYVFETSVMALFFFWALNGFTLSFNSRVFVYGFIYGIIVVCSLIPSIFMYNYASFAYITFLSGSASLVISLISGVLIFSEEITVEKILRIILMLMATLVIFLGRSSKSENKEKKPDSNATKRANRKKSLKLYFCILVSVLLGAASTVLLKFYALDGAVTDQNSMFFATNIFSAALVLPVLPFTMKRDGVGFEDITKMLKSKKTVYSAITTLNSNIASVITITLLAIMDVSVYTPVASALTFVAMAIAVPIMGEKLTKHTLIATLIAILSVIAPPLISLIK